MSSPSRTSLRNLAVDWLPPRITRSIRKRRAAPTPPPQAAARPPKPRTPRPTHPDGDSPFIARPWPRAQYRVNDDPRWAALTERLLDELRDVDAMYRPTNFWGPGLEELLDDMATMGLSRFKAWPRATFWFLPVYGMLLTTPQMRKTYRFLSGRNPAVNEPQMYRALNGWHEATRDWDTGRMAWDQARWPIDFEAHGESAVGAGWQRYPMRGAKLHIRYGRAYLNYLLLMAALSRHVEAPPTSLVEIGGGYGALGEFLMSHDENFRYVNLDIPPLSIVSSYYLSTVFGEDRVLTPDRVPAEGPLEIPNSAVLPNWRIGDLPSGSYEVFANAFSFQEMEPDVVDNYVAKIADLGVKYVVSLNSLRGKPKLSEGHAIGVADPVTSARIIAMFEQRGYELLATYGEPLVRSAGQVAVLRKI